MAGGECAGLSRFPQERFRMAVLAR
jgi:hypothetical protein